MSQEQQRRPQGELGDPIKYGDVFGVSGELGKKAVKPEDAAMMQSAETAVLGKTQKGGPAAAMQSAANYNISAGAVQPGDVTDVAAQEGVTVTGTAVPGANIITESVAGQVVGQYIQPTGGMAQGGGGVQEQQGGGGGGGQQPGGGGITIGQALEATAQTIPGKPIDQSDAAAIQAAEIRATGSNVITPGGVAATAQSAAAYNESMMRDEDKVKLGDVLSDATTVLPADRPATRQDAEGVVGAEIRNKQDMSTTPGGVAASVTVAASLNERSRQQS
ncbi:PREDICTED: late embryogenesis abundant protein D-34-like [Nicotiana attenuata]|uniref:Late embryogenesis abundant protein d-34 n=1 Tax=Nicotiana attenuata TaxID=49451 RepID=A0A314LC35_NICAT|nr:PREDICTED: late embryogenesis abundant protein D-34-like [Nicotiana attenuata]OIT38324.1 late embryogenesis abundant protein d-34 [Nicotiana attenuata]